MKYVVAFGKDLYSPWHYDARNCAILGKADSLEEAAQKRAMTGDLVFDAGTGQIVQDRSWLFPWEANYENDGIKPYAVRAIEAGVYIDHLEAVT